MVWRGDGDRKSRHMREALVPALGVALPSAPSVVRPVGRYARPAAGSCPPAAAGCQTARRTRAGLDRVQWRRHVSRSLDRSEGDAPTLALLPRRSSGATAPPFPSAGSPRRPQSGHPDTTIRRVLTIAIDNRHDGMAVRYAKAFLVIADLAIMRLASSSSEE